MKRLACFLCLSGLFALSAQAQQQQAARELSLRLFSTRAVKTLSIDANQTTTMQLCDGCKRTSVPSGFTVSTSAGNKQLLVAAKPVAKLALSGHLHLKTGDGRTADAAGQWKISVGDNGLRVLLTLPSERYVMAVLQSEAGPDDGPESLKALAVVARSFALTQSNRHGVEGLCDSTHCQAARFNGVSLRVRDAVLATAGEALWFGGKQVSGYFTQDCGGTSEDAAELWGGEKEPWLRVHQDPWCQKQPAHWHASVSGEELARSLDAEGFGLRGVVTGLRVLSRDSSGRAAKVEVRGTSTLKVLSAPALRFAVNRALGWYELRSDWYSVQTIGDHFVFEGRGYGHGVGLCQAGAAEMAHEGKRYRETLAFYFSGTQVRVNANDEGWRQQEANGWTLRSVRADADLLHAGDASLARARQAWGAPTNVHPVVTVAPDTELFRQLTNEPGWTLASTQGDRITLQPPALVRTHGPVATLLLHEFLHAIVESESSRGTPLWLREGLVEALAGEKTSAPLERREQIDQALQSASTLHEAQTAHAAAETLVQKLVAKFGLNTVRGWLRGGVTAGVLTSQ